MIVNGTGGANTTTGILFEDKVDLATALEGKEVGLILKKHDFVRYMKDELGRDARKILSSILLPDNALITEKIIHIIEVKYQQVSGSVDEKLQTCLFKKRQYEKLAEETGKKVVYTYILNDWFKDKKYKDVLKYIEDVGCHYFFNEIPLDFLVNGD